MPGEPVSLGPFKGGLRNYHGNTELLGDDELFHLENAEVDIDGSIVNRPAIRPYTYGGVGGDLTGARLLGTWRTNFGKRYLVAYFPVTASIRLIDVDTGGAFGPGLSNIKVSAAVQYNNRLWIIATPDSNSVGGFYSTDDVNVTWTAVTAIPRGRSGVVYKDRLVITTGRTLGNSNPSRVFYSEPGDFANWPSINFFDISPGDGQQVIDVRVLGNDLLLFKNRSTWRWTFDKLVENAQLTLLDSSVGVSDEDCAVVYNSSLFVLSGNTVREYSNGSFQTITDGLDMRPKSPPPDIFAEDQVALTLFNDRLFCRYYDVLYVYNLKSQRWCTWTSSRNFSRVVTVTDERSNTETALMASSSSSQWPGNLFYMVDNRYEGVGTDEFFNWVIITKMYDFQLPEQFKVMFWGGFNLATAGNTVIEGFSPQSPRDVTWEEAIFTWEGTDRTWGLVEGTRLYQDHVVPDAGLYGRRFYKGFRKKVRFRQIYFKLQGQCLPSSGANYSARFFDMRVMIKSKQIVTKGIN